MGNRFCLLVVGFGLSLGLFAQSPELVFDFNQELVDNAPRKFFRFDSSHFTFEVTTKSFPYSIWISDGTESGTRPFTELDPINPLSGFLRRIEFGDKVFLHKSSSGNISSTFKLYDKKSRRLQSVYTEDGSILNAASFPVINGKNALFTAMTNGQYFDVYSIQSGDTVAKKIFETNPSNIIPGGQSIFETKHGLIFTHSALNTGVELFKIDTINDSIQLLVELDTGINWGLQLIEHEHAGYIYFRHAHFTRKNEIWRSDGTDTGTQLFQKEADLKGNVSHSYFSLNDSILLIKIEGSYDKLLHYNSNTNELLTLVEKVQQSNSCEINFLGTWPDSKIVQVNDGQSNYFLNLNELNPDTIKPPNLLTNQTLLSSSGSGGKIAVRIGDFSLPKADLYIYSQNQWEELTSTDGPFISMALNQHFYFVDADSGRTVIKKDTTILNKLMLTTVSKLLAETLDPIMSIIEHESGIYNCVFETNFGHSKVYRLDGGSAPSLKLELPGFYVLYKIDSNLIFLQKYWSSDSTRIYRYDPVSNKLTDSLYLPPQFTLQSGFKKLNERYFFNANHSPFDNELWFFEPDSGFRKYISGEDYQILGLFKQRLYFEQSVSGNYPNKLFSTDGHDTGVLPFNFTTSGKRIDGITQFIPTDSFLFFVCSDSVHGREFWKSDGSSQGTQILFDIYPGSTSSNPSRFIRVNDSFYFTANSNYYNRFMYATDLEGQNLRIVSDSTNSVIIGNRLLPFQNKLFFTYRQSNRYDLVGVYHTNEGIIDYLADSLTTQGTPFKSDHLTSIEIDGGTGPFLYLNAFNDEFGREIWKTDGTKNGTMRITDIFPGKGDSDPGFIANRNDTLYISAYNPLVGREIWRLYTGCLFINFEVTSPCQNEFSHLESGLMPFDQDSVTVQWIINQSDTLFGDSLTYQFIQNGTHSIQLVAANKRCKKSLAKQIMVGKRTQANVELSEDTLCFADHLITGTISESNPAKTFVWSWGDGNTSSGKMSVHQFGTAGEYHLQVVGSEQGSCLDSQNFRLVIHPTPPQPPIIGPIYSEQSIDTFYTTNHPGSSYFWSSDAGTLNQVISDSAISFLWKYPTGYATVFLYEENKYQCSSVQSSHMIQRKQIQSSKEEEVSLVQIYPNPVTSFVHIETNGASITSIVVLDMSGKQLMEQPFSEQSESVHMNVQSLPPGPYLLKINTPTSSQFQIIIKE